MTAMDVVEQWDRTLRIGDWDAARALLAKDATYTAPEAGEGQAVDCATPDDIIALLRSFKGKLPEVESSSGIHGMIASSLGRASRLSARTQTGSRSCGSPMA